MMRPPEKDNRQILAVEDGRPRLESFVGDDDGSTLIDGQKDSKVIVVSKTFGSNHFSS